MSNLKYNSSFLKSNRKGYKYYGMDLNDDEDIGKKTFGHWESVDVVVELKDMLDIG